MAGVERSAEVTWEGGLADGRGRFSVGSGAMRDQEVTWASRTERSEGRTSPEELIAAALGSCFSMALSHTLGQGGTPPQRLDVRATSSFERGEGGFSLSHILLEVHGSVPGLDDRGFVDAAHKAGQTCPVSRALQGNVEIEVRAALEGQAS